MVNVAIDGAVQEAQPDELLIDLINRTGASVPHVCYHPQLGPVKTCDTCMVELNGRLVRACATAVADGMKISTKSAKAAAALVEAFDRILSNHLLYCTLCHNNNGNCTVHNTTKLLAIEHQLNSFPIQALRSRQHESVLPLRSRSMHSLWPLRRSLPERRGQRNPFHQLGRSESPRTLGRRLNHRRVELRFMRPLRHRLPVQCPDGKNHAGSCRFLNFSEEVCSELHDRRGQRR